MRGVKESKLFIFEPEFPCFCNNLPLFLEGNTTAWREIKEVVNFRSPGQLHGLGPNVFGSFVGLKCPEEQVCFCPDPPQFFYIKLPQKAQGLVA